MEVITRSGKTLNILKPQAELINIEDIAWALSNQCRFNGHTKIFYSVAEHCTYMARYFGHSNFNRHTVLAALLHDAAEAYIGDITRPVKKLWPEIEKIERRLLWVILEKYGVNVAEVDWTSIEEIDNRLGQSEMNVLVLNKLVLTLPLNFDIQGLSAGAAREEFLRLFFRYGVQK